MENYVIISNDLAELMGSSKINQVVQRAIEKGCLSIEADAKQVCPVRTGNLRASIHTEIQPLRGEVGTNVQYAPYVEFGTSKQVAQPYLEPAFLKNKDRIINEIQRGLLND